MKYKDIVTTREGYHPVFDLKNESPNSWKRFIPNDNFYEVLSTTLNSIDPTTGHNIQKSIWIRGTYGTGKSHAASVIKHLLWDDYKDIENFVEELDERNAARIKNFRKKNKVFPVVIKGASNIVDNRSFSAAIQKAVSEAFYQNKIKIETKTDFETFITFIHKNNHYPWSDHINECPELKIYVKTKEDIMKKLENSDVKVLRLLENSLMEKNINVLVPNVSEWLKNIVEELKCQDIAQYIMIFWDEFTSILDLEQKGMSSGGVSASEWQNIAELSRDNSVYLFIVSHRFPSHYSKEEEKKTLDRFNSVNYIMERLTTFHIMEGAIKKIKKKEWNELKEKYVVSNPELVELAKALVDDEGSKVTNTVIDLFPIHPYTSYLTTFISRYLGSAQRSVFDFLTNTESGFLKFIEDNPQGKGNKGIFLTPDLLWVFFLDEFENMDLSMAAPILDKYKANRKLVEETGEENLAIFHAALLLNLLNYVTKVQESSSSHVIPSETNIQDMFLGTSLEKHVISSLEYLNSNNIIEKNPHGIFEITASNLDTKKVNDEVEKLKSNFSLFKALNNDHIGELTKIFTSGCLRQIDIHFYDASEPEHLLNSKLHKDFSNCSYMINMAVFLTHDNSALASAEKLLSKLSFDDYFKNVIFTLSQEPLKVNLFDKYLQYKARANIAANINNLEECKNNQEHANIILDDWIREIRQQYALCIFRGELKKTLAHEVVEFTKKEISPEIFPCGLENTGASKHDSIWRLQKSKTAIEVTLFADTRSELGKDATQQFKPLQAILKDLNQEWIVNNSLEIKNDVDNSHPIVRARALVTQLMEENNSSFHLGQLLQPLSMPPYGYYKNSVSQAAVGFLMRPYVYQLYDQTGIPIDDKDMREKILAVFDYLEDGKERANVLQMRFGTPEEKELIDKLKEIFKLESNIKSLSDARWKIGDKINKTGYPLWVYKEFTKNKHVKEIIDEINMLIRTIDTEIEQVNIKSLLGKVDSLFFDLMTIIDENKNNCKMGFTNWMKNMLMESNVEFPEINEEKTYTELLTYIKQENQGEIKLWEENTVAKAVLAWILQNTGNEGSSDASLGQTTGSIFTPIEMKSVQTTLDNYIEKYDVQKLKDAIIKAVKEQPSIWLSIKKHLGD